MSNLFLVSWDCNGLEAVINITDYEKETTWATLKDEDPPVKLASMVNHLMLRARANSQRHYEIYTMNVQEGITDEDIRSMFDADPQGSADLVRDRGNKIYSDRVNQKEVKIV
ncbi:hypothetical protein UFOVP112_69 [uncultured Caudovirales phage]|uniref:Uncharacterized protein n=1 Tax=uncultured Caudovirales phage TaxID=2100421 RepID=A0A6J5L324_9CAUD|nr:hypothetical protein UFOVP112_69 [uncultured Caudovirales phage]